MAGTVTTSYQDRLEEAKERVAALMLDPDATPEARHEAIGVLFRLDCADIIAATLEDLRDLREPEVRRNTQLIEEPRPTSRTA